MNLKTVDLRRSFSDFNLLVNFEAKEGELICLLGPSGCGKTTALQLIAGIQTPDSGRIYLGDRDITDLPPWKRNIGLVFQDYALFPHMSVEENIAYGLRQKGTAAETIHSRVKELLSLVRLQGYCRRKPHELSGGEKQRVALARAVAPSPSLLLLDEPLSALDARLRIKLRREIREIQQRIGLTTIYVTHDQEEALSISDRIIMMKDGEIQQIGTPQEMYNHPINSFVAKFIGNANLLPVSKRTEDRKYYFFRPDDTRLSTTPSAAADIFEKQMTIRSVEYAGSHYVVEGSDGESSLRAHLRQEPKTSISFGDAPGSSCWFQVEKTKLKLLSH